MNIQDLFKLLRTRWVTVLVTTATLVMLVTAYTAMQTPMYQATTRLFVSTTAGQSAADLYQGNRLSQERVLSYTELLMGKTLAQRTVDKIDLKISADALAAKVRATAKPDTVLIDVNVLDASPVRARDIANSLSDEFVAMVRELETPNPGARPEARVVVQQRATIPESPAVPNPKRRIATGLALGLLLGTGLAILREGLDNTVKGREMIEKITNVGLAGNVPFDKERRKETAISFESSNTAISEAFRKLRTNLQFFNVDNPPKVVVITSSNPAEGKTTTAVNLALALAEAEHCVVLVDGDMRRPSVDKCLDLVGSVGFSTVLSGAANLSDVLQTTKHPRLTVLAAGTVPPNPSELLGSQSARRVISDLRERFDYVIIDSPPLLAVTDGAILATNADGALIMARPGKTTRKQLAHAVTILQNVGATLLGAVYTMTPIRGDSYYGEYKYSYYGEGDSRGASQIESATDHIRTDSAMPDAASGTAVATPESASKSPEASN